MKSASRIWRRDEREVNFGLVKEMTVCQVQRERNPLFWLLFIEHFPCAHFLEAISINPHNNWRKGIISLYSFYRCGNWQYEGFSVAAKASLVIYITSSREEDLKPCLHALNLAPSGSRTRFGWRRKRNSIYPDHESLGVRRPGHKKTGETNGPYIQIILGGRTEGPQIPSLNLNRLSLKVADQGLTRILIPKSSAIWRPSVLELHHCLRQDTNSSLDQHSDCEISRISVRLNMIYSPLDQWNNVSSAQFPVPPLTQ